MDRPRLFIMGLGHVGRALLGLLSEADAPPCRIVGLADSSCTMVIPDGLPIADVPGIAEAKRLGRGLSTVDALRGASRLAPGRPDDAFEAARPDLVVDLTPTDTATGGAALVNALAAFRAGADVVFAGKGALAAAWDRVMDAAGRRVRFSATVGAGLPVIDAGRAFAASNPVDSIEALVNGTSVYVLTLMEGGLCLEAAVAEAQARGYAEADPSADLDGLDAAAKLCILSRAVMDLPLSMDRVERQSVRSVSLDAIERAMADGARLRAVGRIVREGNEARACVRIEAVPATSILARSGTDNAVVFHSRRAGDLALVGRGAGPVETALAVLRDVVTVRKYQ